MTEQASATKVVSRSPVWIPSPGNRPHFLREHGVFLGLIAGYVAVGLVVDWSGIVPGMMGRMKFVLAYLLTPMFVLLATPIALAGRFWAVLRENDREYGQLTWAHWRAAWRRCKSEMLNRERLAAVAAVSFASPILLTAVGSWKAAIPLLNGFSWDMRLSRLDATLHLGTPPWELLNPALGRPWVTTSLDHLYAWWILLVPIVLTWQAWSSRWELRRHFFITYALTWMVLGTGFAIAFSSAGPCFLTLLGLDGSAYEPLMRYLHSVHSSHPMFVIETQEKLWRAYTTNLVNPFIRISAMPSMHVAMVALYTLVGWRTWKPLGVLFACYAVVIFLGSVHLGWHYAVDGYVSIIAVIALWYATGVILRLLGRGQLERRDESR